MSGRRSFSSRSASSQSLVTWGKKSLALSTDSSSAQSEHAIYGGSRGGNSFSDDLLDRFKSGQKVNSMQRVKRSDSLQNLVKIR